MNDWSTYLIPIAIDAIATLGLYVIVNSGRISAGHTTFVGLGSYAGGVATAHWSSSIYVMMLSGLVVGALAGGVFSLLVERLDHWFFAVATIALTYVAAGLISNTGFLGGGIGMVSTQINVDLKLAIECLVAVLIVVWSYDRSKWGRCARAVRDDATAATGLGMSPMLVHARSFAIGSALAGLAGALNFGYLASVAPDAISVDSSLLLLVYLTIGGSQWIGGALLGTFALDLVPQFNQALGDYRMELYGGLVVLVMIFAPRGAWGELLRLTRTATESLRRRRAPKVKSGASAVSLVRESDSNSG